MSELPPENELFAVRSLLLRNKLGCPSAEFVGLLYQELMANKRTNKKGKKWIKLSYEGWKKLGFYHSRSTFWREIKQLEDLGIIVIEKLSDFKGDRTNHYALNLDTLYQHIKP